MNSNNRIKSKTTACVIDSVFTYSDNGRAAAAAAAPPLKQHCSPRLDATARVVEYLSEAAAARGKGIRKLTIVEPIVSCSKMISPALKEHTYGQ